MFCSSLFVQGRFFISLCTPLISKMNEEYPKNELEELKMKKMMSVLMAAMLLGLCGCIKAKLIKADLVLEAHIS